LGLSHTLDIAVSVYQSSAVRTTVTLDDDVFEIVQAQAQASGMRLGEVLSQMVRAGLNTSVNTSTVNGLPVFKIPADAEIIPSNRAREILAEEGL
jgi:hypothetical protein